MIQETPYPIITRAKQTEGVPQVIEGLLCKLKALSSKPSPTLNQFLVTHAYNPSIGEAEEENLEFKARLD
jgi:hypothetical protein